MFFSVPGDFTTVTTLQEKYEETDGFSKPVHESKGQGLNGKVLKYGICSLEIQIQERYSKMAKIKVN